jgi:hypothetical protein
VIAEERTPEKMNTSGGEGGGGYIILARSPNWNNQFTAKT